MLGIKNRFHGHGSLGYVYKNGDAVRSHLATIKYVKNTRRNESRVAVVVSKKVHKSAVGRNRIRRRIYEIMRQELPAIHESYDIAVIVISGEAIATPHEELQRVIHEMLESTPVF